MEQTASQQAILKLELEYVNKQLRGQTKRKGTGSQKRKKVSDEQLALEEYRDIILIEAKNLENRLLSQPSEDVPPDETVDEDTTDISAALTTKQVSRKEAKGEGDSQKKRRFKQVESDVDEKEDVLMGPRRSKRTKVAPRYYDEKKTKSIHQTYRALV